MEKMRSDFESAIKKSVYALIAEDGQLCQRGDDGDYRHSVVQAAWWGWQVASASRGGKLPRAGTVASDLSRNPYPI